MKDYNGDDLTQKPHEAGESVTGQHSDTGIERENAMCSLSDDKCEANMSSEDTPVKSNSSEDQVRDSNERHGDERFPTPVRGMRVGDCDAHEMQTSRTKIADGKHAQSGVLRALVCFTCGVVAGVALTVTFFVWGLSHKRVFPAKVY